jgi:hypothetical protein
MNCSTLCAAVFTDDETMSFLRWFGKKGPSPESTPSLNSDLGQVDATMPIHQPQHTLALQDLSADASSSRKFERMGRRESLYGVVRECMTGAGLLSSAYKFKVLSLDSAGRKYLIMMDLPQQQMADPVRFAQIEGTIARSAKERYDILITAIYWRVNEMVTTGARSNEQMHAPEQAQTKAPEPVTVLRPPSSPDVAAPNYAPIQDDEVLAFKRAVATAASGAAAVKRGEVIRSGRRNPQPQQDFSNTEPFDANSPLGPTQFGGLT